MYTYKDLTAEITDKVEAFLTANRVCHPDWVTEALMQDHADLSGGDEECALFSMRANFRNEVRRHINRFKLTPELAADPQLVLPGFRRLQMAYLVTRDSQQVAVPVQSLTNVEIEAKCIELVSMSNGCLEHVEELRRYLADRVDTSRLSAGT